MKCSSINFTNCGHICRGLQVNFSQKHYLSSVKLSSNPFAARLSELTMVVEVVLVTSDPETVESDRRKMSTWSDHLAPWLSLIQIKVRDNVEIIPACIVGSRALFLFFSSAQFSMKGTTCSIQVGCPHIMQFPLPVPQNYHRLERQHQRNTKRWSFEKNAKLACQFLTNLAAVLCRATRSSVRLPWIEASKRRRRLFLTCVLISHLQWFVGSRFVFVWKQELEKETNMKLGFQPLKWNSYRWILAACHYNMFAKVFSSKWVKIFAETEPEPTIARTHTKFFAFFFRRMSWDICQNLSWKSLLSTSSSLLRGEWPWPWKQDPTGETNEHLLPKFTAHWDSENLWRRQRRPGNSFEAERIFIMPNAVLSNCHHFSRKIWFSESLWKFTQCQYVWNQD